MKSASFRIKLLIIFIIGSFFFSTFTVQSISIEASRDIEELSQTACNSCETRPISKSATTFKHKILILYKFVEREELIVNRLVNLLETQSSVLDAGSVDKSNSDSADLNNYSLVIWMFDVELEDEWVENLTPKLQAYIELGGTMILMGKAIFKTAVSALNNSIIALLDPPISASVKYIEGSSNHIVFNSIGNITQFNPFTTIHVDTNAGAISIANYNYTSDGEPLAFVAINDQIAMINTNITSDNYNQNLNINSPQYFGKVISNLYDEFLRTKVITLEQKQDLLEYEQGTTGHTISWVPAGSFGTYNITQGDLKLRQDVSWTQRERITINVSGYLEGEHSYTISLINKFGNTLTHTVTVRVFDNPPVFLNSPANLSLEVGTNGVFLRWGAYDSKPSNYTIFRNSTIIETERPWISNQLINVSLDNLLLGVYNFTIQLTDLNGRFTTHTVFVSTLLDFRPKFLVSPADQRVEASLNKIRLTWIGADATPSGYTIKRDNLIIDAETSWTTSQPIEILVDAIRPGNYTIQLTLFDTMENFAKDEVNLEVVDSVAPSITIVEGNEVYEGFSPIVEEGEDYTLSYNIEEINLRGIAIGLYKNNALVYVNATIFDREAPVTTSTIFHRETIPGLRLVEGRPYRIRLYVEDFAGNGASFPISPIPFSVVDTKPPTYTNLTTTKIQYEVNSKNVEFKFTARDNSQQFIIALGNRGLLYSVPQLGITNQVFTRYDEEIALNITGFQVGVHVITINLEDVNGFTTDFSIEIQVLPASNPILQSSFKDPKIFEPDKTATENLTWVFTDANPDTFEVFLNNASRVTDNWQSGQTIRYTLPEGLKQGIHNVSIVIRDDLGGITVYQRFVYITDGTAPELVESPDDLTFFYGELGNVLEWQASDFVPTDFQITLNGTVIQSGNWNNQSKVEISLDSLPPGNYIYRAQYNNIVGNNTYHQVQVRILEDISAPTITGLNNVSFPFGISSLRFELQITDQNTGVYSILYNEVLVGSGDYSSEAITLVINNLSIGKHIYTITATDRFNNQRSIRLIITIYDPVAPTITGAKNYDVEAGQKATLIFTIEDDTNGTYRILKGGSKEILNSTWVSGDIIFVIIDVASLSLGINEFTISAQDVYGNIGNFSLSVLVSDSIAPQLTRGQQVFSFEEGRKIVLTWIVTELNPKNYSVYLDDVLAKVASWESNTGISFDVSALTAENYTIRLDFYDTTGNFRSDQFRLQIFRQRSPQILSGDDLEFVAGTSGNIITWVLSDNSPTTYSLLKNGRVIVTKSYQSGESVTTNLDSLSPGMYNYTLVAYDELGNSSTKSVFVTIHSGQQPTDFAFLEIILTLVIIFALFGSFLLLYIWQNRRAERKTAVTTQKKQAKETVEVTKEDERVVISKAKSSKLHSEPKQVEVQGTTAPDENTQLEQIQGVDKVISNVLRKAGYNSVESIQRAKVSELTTLGILSEFAKSIIKQANELQTSKVESSPETAMEPGKVQPSVSLESVQGIGKVTAKKLRSAGFVSVEDLVQARIDEIIKLGLGKKRVEKIMDSATEINVPKPNIPKLTEKEDDKDGQDNSA